MTVKIYSLPSDAMSPPVAEGFVTDFVLASDYAELQRKVEALAVESATLKTFIEDECYVCELFCDDADCHRAEVPNTPATDAALADIRAQGGVKALEDFADFNINSIDGEDDEYAAILKQVASAARGFANNLKGDTQ